MSKRFDPGTYVALSDAMSLHDVYQGRGLGALRDVAVPTRVVGILSDRLYPLYLQQQIADELGVRARRRRFPVRPRRLPARG
ncbi:MAG: hypothetical protein U0R27_01720 [Candidatus Nanopelagicales bacterium]